jgi:3-oxoacyl-[acyl-carrier-protein] synthase II
MNDRCETAAVKSTFGEHAKDLVISSTKSMIGHTLGASGALEAIVTMEALSRQMAPPTIGYKVPDPDCDLDVCPNEAKKIETEYAMSNSFGFGGHNGSLIFRRVSE